MYHVLPMDDLKDHVMSVDCWCHPTYAEPIREVLVHNSLDGREARELLVELTGEN
jgi:hypothetical protein